MIAAGGLERTFQTFDFSATNIQHGLLVTGLVMQERTYQFTKHLLTHLFQKPMSLNRHRLDLTITQAFSGARQALFWVSMLPATLNTRSLLLLATGWDG